MGSNTDALGQAGEALAVAHLQALGYEVVCRNWRTSLGGLRGELDVVARDRQTLVFCEVKTRRGVVAGERALAAVDGGKQRRLRRLAASYLAATDGHRGPVRFDVIAVAWPPSGGQPRLVHVPAAF